MSDTIEFCGELKAETQKAYLVFDGEEDVWIPKSRIRSMRRVGANANDYELVIPVWLAREKGII